MKAQESIIFQRLGTHRFSDGEKEGSLHRFKHVFENDHELLSHYRDFNSWRVAQRVVNYTSATLFIGTFLVSRAAANGPRSGTSSDVIGPALAIIGGGFITGTVFIVGNLLTGVPKAAAKKRLLSSLPPHDFNLGYSPSLHLGLSQYGVGLQLQF